MLCQGVLLPGKFLGTIYNLCGVVMLNGDAEYLDGHENSDKCQQCPQNTWTYKMATVGCFKQMSNVI